MLVIQTRCGRTYCYEGVTNVRRAKRELRWSSANGEKRQMALAFIEGYSFS